jgi:hypothetical protein
LSKKLIDSASFGIGLEGRTSTVNRSKTFAIAYGTSEADREKIVVYDTVFREMYKSYLSLINDKRSLSIKPQIFIQQINVMTTISQRCRLNRISTQISPIHIHKRSPNMMIVN